MSTTEEKQTKIGDAHPVGPVLDDWAEWVSKDGKGDLTIQYEEEEDVFLVERDGRKAVIYTSDIDEDFYGEAQALFVETEIGEPPSNLDLSQTLKFSGNELVLSRISLTERNGKFVLLVEAAIPLSRLVFANFDLTVREVATIGRDLRKHLSGVMKTEDDTDEDEDDDDDGDDE